MGIEGHGCGQVVSVLAFYSDDPSSNPAEAYSFSVNFVFEKNQNKQKEGGVGHFFKKILSAWIWTHDLSIMSLL